MQIPDNPKLAYSILEAANAISCGRSFIYLMLADGRLESRKIGKRTITPAVSLRRLLEAA